VSVFFTVILIAGAYAVSHKRGFLVLAIALATGMLSAQWLAHLQHVNPVTIAISRGFGFLFFLLTAIAILSDVLKSKMVDGGHDLRGDLRVSAARVDVGISPLHA